MQGQRIASIVDADQIVIDGTFKGVPCGTAPFPIGRIGEKNWNVLMEHLPLPVALIKRSALEGNLDWMRRFLAASGVMIAPNGKTSMSPQLFRRQLESGAWAITLATVSQVRVARQFGVSRILMANELLGPIEEDYILGEIGRDPGFDFYCLVDSEVGVARLGEAARRVAPGRPLQVLVERGSKGFRAGCRTDAEVLAVGRAVAANSPWLTLRGVEGFEGILSGICAADVETRIGELLNGMISSARLLQGEGLFAEGPVILTAGGSVFFDLVAEALGRADIGRKTQVVLRSGCYLAQDSGLYEKAFKKVLARSAVARSIGGGLRNVLEIWTRVISRPEPGRAILGFGKRDSSYDISLPKPTAWFRAGLHDRPQAFDVPPVLSTLDDQHAYLDLPEGSPLAVGDLIQIGISHPCTTFEKWRVLPIVDDDYTVVDAALTFF